MTLNRINIILILFFIINFNQNYLYANQDGFIVMKINNEIITNLDIENEYNYLISLNNELTKLKKNEIVALAKKSIITEKVKFLELKKYYDFKSDNKDLLDNIIKNISLMKHDSFNTVAVQTYSLDSKGCINKNINSQCGSICKKAI